MATLKVRKISSFNAEMEVPGDKSISHRAVMFAALSNGPCEISGFLPSEDCLATAEAMRSLGVEVEELDPEPCRRLRVHGCKGAFSPPEQDVDCGNSGTTMRLLSGVLASQLFASRLVGDDSLSKRPMNRIARPLEQMGATVTGRGRHCTAPLKIAGPENGLRAIGYESPVASAQVKSAILLAGMKAEGRTSVSEPSLSRDHTERMLDFLQVKTVREGNTVSIWGGQTPESRDIVVPGDISSAAFWIVAAAVQPGARLLVRNVGLNSTRTGILAALSRMGANIVERIDDSGCEPMGTVEVTGRKLQATEVAGAEIPELIDEVPILAVAAALAEGTTSIRDAAELRVKECDRISAVAENLRRMGVPVEEFADGMEITGVKRLKGAEVESLGDHRIAMAFAIAGLHASGETVVNGSECIATSYPGFQEEIEQLLLEEGKL